MYGTSTIIKATNAVAADTRDTSHSLRETTNTMVVRDQEAISAILERAESPARGPTTMGSPSTQSQFRSFQLSYQLQALSSPSTPRISPPERPTNVPGYSSNDTERNDERHSVATGNMASSSYTPDETGEQLPKYMERDHDLPDYADQRAAPVT
ncbi:hypothetical protein V499_05154 [Pseudogymnoascus sp. VKM F-103]|nr:hypothetical protein V499_05154 [Pseudogymnoascus sp. VKM F-103]